ncbi:response regulator [Candidatus Micrarchaeota archaeon]|nr:response regulator [Candidatus Micrarchaeota archaeon]
MSASIERGPGPAPPSRDGKGLTASGKRPGILVVDDEPVIAKAIARILAAAGYSVQTAENGVEALERFKSGGIGLILSDYNMPLMNGLELLAQIKSIAPSVPVITHAAGLDEGQQAGLRENGIFRILDKPAPRDEIVSAVECALRSPFAGQEPLADNIAIPAESLIRVLYVDDNMDTRDSMADIFGLSGFGIMTAACGEDALAAYSLEKPDVVVSDFHMPPGMNGLELLRALRTKDPCAAVIIVSGDASDDERKALLDAGAYAVLQKPVEFSALSCAVKKALAKE